jgi:hypothetical protein
MSDMEVLDQYPRPLCAMSSSDRPMRGETGLTWALVSPVLTPFPPTRSDP